MNTPSTRTRRIATAAATPVAIVAAAALVWQSSYAAFTGTTRNSGNDWATGSVALTDDGEGVVEFERGGEAAADDEVVVDDEDGGRCAH